MIVTQRVQKKNDVIKKYLQLVVGDIFFNDGNVFGFFL